MLNLKIVYQVEPSKCLLFSALKLSLVCKLLAARTENLSDSWAVLKLYDSLYSLYALYITAVVPWCLWLLCSVFWKVSCTPFYSESNIWSALLWSIRNLCPGWHFYDSVDIGQYDGCKYLQHVQIAYDSTGHPWLFHQLLAVTKTGQNVLLRYVRNTQYCSVFTKRERTSLKASQVNLGTVLCLG